MDDRARDEMVREGFPGERLAVTGQPALDDLSGYLEPAARKAARLETRHLAGCRSEERCVLFASQPLSDVRSPEELGFHHRDVLRHVVIELGRVLDRRASRATLVIRPHPREIDRPYLLPTPTTDHLTLVYLPDLDVSSRTLAVGSDLVVGMNSMLLQEACLMRAPVLSYQPGLRVEEMLPANRYGWSRAVYERGNLAAALEAELFDQEAGVARRRILDAIEPPVGATERVTDLLLDAA
jgi:hypothetical protein